MRRTLLAALAATVALPVTATSAAAQEGRYGYTPSDDIPYHWAERRQETDRYDAELSHPYYAGRGSPPSPPRTPDRYITSWDRQGGGFGPGPGYMPRDYGEDEYYAGRGRPPHPPYSPERYVTDWSDVRDRGSDMYRYGQLPPEHGRAVYGPAPFADDRWAERPRHRREFDRPSPPPGWEADQAFREGYRRGYELGVDRGAYERGVRDERGFDPYAGHRRADRRGPDHMARMHREMQAGMRGEGYEDRDFRRDFRQDGRRGYYQDPTYEEMPHSRPGEARRLPRPDMHAMRRAMRMIDAYDVDDDRRVTEEEIRQTVSDELERFDRDEQAGLNVEEYEQLWLEGMRGNVVGRFQRYDENADGVITPEEFASPRTEMLRGWDRDRDEVLSARDFGMEERPTEDYTGRPEVRAPLDSDQPDVVTDETETEAAGIDAAPGAENVDEAPGTETDETAE